MNHCSSHPSCEMLSWLVVVILRDNKLCWVLVQVLHLVRCWDDLWSAILRDNELCCVFVQVFHLVRCWDDLWSVILRDNELCIALVFYPARCELTHSLSSCGMMVVFWSYIDAEVWARLWYGGEGYNLYSLWLVLLESAKDLFLGVDPQDNMCHQVSGMEQLAY
jgi:hypothetical protein